MDGRPFSVMSMRSSDQQFKYSQSKGVSPSIQAIQAFTEDEDNSHRLDNGGKKEKKKGK